MYGLLKFSLFLCSISWIQGYFNVRDDVPWFKDGQKLMDGQKLKNRFVSGAVNGITDIECNDTSTGAEEQGECMPKLECGKAGGKMGSLCSLLGVCCVQKKTCGETTSAKVSYFVPPQKFESVCDLNVNTYSKDVCQIRLDFEEFDIAKPTSHLVSSSSTNSVNSSYQCIDDCFIVENVRIKLGFKHLCGKNRGQHIYIPLIQDNKSIKLKFHLKPRLSDSGLNEQKWKIKIRQLECRKSGHEFNLSAPSKLMSMYNDLKNKKRKSNDWEWIAPPHCLQYFPERQGVFESFNYDDGNGCYIGGLDYAICFKKSPDICKAKYTAIDKFQMNYNTKMNSKELKCNPNKPDNTTTSRDYIRIPGALNNNQEYQNLYCDTDFEKNEEVTVDFNHPLYVGVHTDDIRPNTDTNSPEDFAEIGFRFRYELTSGFCN